MDSAFDTARPWRGDPPDVVYNPGIPSESFDFVIVDECHRSIYDLWSQVLLYFDAVLIGLTATPAGKTIGFFNQNLVMQYDHDAAVADDTGVYVDVRHKLTRAERLQLLNQDLTYTANQLDRDVVSESQIRTVLRPFRDKVLPDAFPGRAEVPKTLIFAKDDLHADDIVRLVREVFAAGNDFCQKSPAILLTGPTGATTDAACRVRSALALASPLKTAPMAHNMGQWQPGPSPLRRRFPFSARRQAYGMRRSATPLWTTSRSTPRRAMSSRTRAAFARCDGAGQAPGNAAGCALSVSIMTIPCRLTCC